MMTATSGISGPPLTFNATVSGLAIYLDNFSMKRLAKGDPSRRNRLIKALHTGGADLLFSVANAAELTGPQGRSLDAIRTFLDEVGPHWFPVELDPFVIAIRELKGADPAESCVSTDFIKQYSATKTTGSSPNSRKVIDLSDQFFRLGAVLDWVGSQRESIRICIENLDAALIKKISDYRGKFKRDSRWLDQAFPALPFNPSKPATFTYVNLVRAMIVERAYQLKKGDGLDFCHAVVASAFSNFATLDKHWKRRVQNLPRPNGLARIYFEPEIDRMMTEIEFCLKQDGAPR